MYMKRRDFLALTAAPPVLPGLAPLLAYRNVPARRQPGAYFIDSLAGNDNNNGLSPTTAWATVDKADATPLTAAQIVFQKINGVWQELRRGPWVPGDYYVDTANGFDSNNGTAASRAFKTISKALALIAAGQRVKIKAGTYVENLLPIQAGNASQPIAIEAYGDGNVIVKPSSGPRALSQQYSYWQWSCIVFDGSNVNSQTCIVLNTTNCTFAFCTFRKAASNANVWVQNASAIEFYNCDIVEGKSTGLEVYGDASVKLRNCIVSGNLGAGIYVTSGGKCDIDYSCCLGNSWSPVTNIFGTITDGGHNVFTRSPQLVSYAQNRAMISWTLDDTDTVYWLNVAFEAEAVGKRVTGFIIASSGAGLENNLQELVIRGHDIGSHTWSHSHLTEVYALTVGYTGSAANCEATVVPDVSITLATSDHSGDHTLDLTSPSYATIDQIRAAISGFPGYACTLNPSVAAAMKPSALGAMSNQDIKTAAYNLPIVTQVLVNQEMRDSVAWIENAIPGFVPTVLAYPGGMFSAQIEGFVRDAGVGILGARATDQESAAINNGHLESIPLYAIWGVWGNYLLGADESITRANARHFAEFCVACNIVLSVYSHNESEVPAIHAGYMISEWAADPRIDFDLFRNHVAKIRADHTTTDNLTWRHTYPDVHDYRLTTTSPCINAGTHIAGLDLGPRSIKPDVGAYGRA